MYFKKTITAVLFLLILSCNIPFLYARDLTSEERVARQAENQAERDAREAHRDAEDASDPLSYEEKLELIIPSQGSLFDNSKKLDTDGDGFLDENEKIRLADGDLEQGLLPQIIRILIGFSSVGFFAFFTFAGVRLLLARGNEEALTKTKDLIMQGVIGSVIIVGSFGIVIGIVRLFNSLA
jgi:hypothetical protein